MSNFILDCDLMKYSNSGLFHYCKNLNEHINDYLNYNSDHKLKVYIPPNTQYESLKTESIIKEKLYHRYIKPFLWDCAVWHAPFQSGRIIPSKRQAKKMGVVLTIHDLNVVHEGKSEREVETSLLHTQSLIDRSDVIVCISEFTKSDVLKNCNVHQKRIEVITNGVNPIEIGGLTNKTYRPFRPFLFGIGYVNPKKNYHTLIELLKGNENLEIVIAGKLDDQDYVNMIYRILSNEGLETRFHLVGPITESEKGWYLRNCLAFVHPSIAEGFGLPVLEAMSVGKSVFTTRFTSLPEIGGDKAFYFDGFEGNSMRATLSRGLQVQLSEDWSQDLVAHSKKFSWKTAAKRYYEVYTSLI